MRLSTLKELRSICTDSELQLDMKADNSKECLLNVLGNKPFLKTFLNAVRTDVKACVTEIKKGSSFFDTGFLQDLLLLKNDLSQHIRTLS